MPLLVRNRKSYRAANDNARPVVLDVTSRGPEPWVRLSPFFPHGGIPVPLSPGRVAQSVEGIWQGLMVFERVDIDVTRLERTTMRGMARASKVLGELRGHRAGLEGTTLLPLVEARWQIFLPAYRFVLEHKVARELEALRALAGAGTVVLIDYDTNGDPDDASRPLSHAALIQRYLEDRWPVPRGAAA